MTNALTADLLLEAYRHGIFPMAESRESDTIHWFRPEMRGIIPLDRFNLPRSLRKFLRTQPFEYRIDTAFAQIVEACGEPTQERRESWINSTLIHLYNELFHRGHAHSVECWQEGRLVGGLYGVHIGGAFFGESMFSRTSNASKAALVELVRILRQNGFVLLDTQYVNDHLRQFGIEEVPANQYENLLSNAIDKPCLFCR